MRLPPARPKGVDLGADLAERSYMNNAQTASLILDFPFAYEMDVLPSRKHRKPRPVALRGYTPVKIPELAGRDVYEAIVIKTAGRNAATDPWTTIYSYGTRLIGPVLSEGGHVTGTDLAVAVGADHKYEIWERDIPAVVRQLPHPAVRNDRAVSPAMFCNTFERQMAINRFTDPQPVRSTEVVRRGEAQGYYSQAVVTLDGLLHVEVPEPVWRVRQQGDAVFVDIELEPNMMAAGRFFRLDQFDRAKRFAQSLGKLEENGGETCVTFLRPDVLTRIDVDEIAKVALAHQHALYGLISRIPGEPRYDWRKFVENRFMISSEKAPSGDAAIAVLDKLEMIWRRIEGAVPGLASFYCASEIADLVARWRFEQENFLPEDVDDLADEDLAALDNLFPECAVSPTPAPRSQGGGS